MVDMTTRTLHENEAIQADNEECYGSLFVSGSNALSEINEDVKELDMTWEKRLELVEVTRSEWRIPMTIPLPPPSHVDAPILEEFSRPWKAFRFPLPLVTEERQVENSVMKNYELEFTPRTPTFPSTIHLSSSLESRVAAPEALAFLVTPHIRFHLGMIEPLVCRLLVYDMAAGCRVTEEFSFQISEPQGEKNQQQTSSPIALMYVLPSPQVQTLCLVLKVSKGLAGDGDLATAPYCSPDKFVSTVERKKLIEKAAECESRLGNYQQPLAWGTIPLAKGSKQSMTLFRQRQSISEEQRLALLSDVARGILKEKTVPASCDFDIEELTATELKDAKFQSPVLHSPPLKMKILDPFSKNQFESENFQSKLVVEESVDRILLSCREVQPFCTPAQASTFGLSGSGPVAISYVNSLFVYPLQLEKCPFRNVAIRIQLLETELSALPRVNEPHDAVLRAIYQANHEIVHAAYVVVSYHQKNPQFEDEVKLCLPEHLTASHHLLFTFYHVHCKKLQAHAPQQELIGYAVLPLLKKDGTILQDTKTTTLNLLLAPKSSAIRDSTMPLPPGYVAAARNAVLDTTKTVFSCRHRVISSIHSQDDAVATFLSPFHGPHDAIQEDEIVTRLTGLCTSKAATVRYFFFVLVKFVLGYLRFGTSIVRWSAFRTLLVVMEKVCCHSRQSITSHEMNHVLSDFVYIVYDENAIQNPNKGREEEEKESSVMPHTSVFSALLEMWLNVLNPTKASSIEANVETKRRSLTFSNVLLQLCLKSMAMSLLSRQEKAEKKKKSKTTSVLLPAKLDNDDEVRLERVLRLLLTCAGDKSNGLLIQKEVNRSVAFFCRGVFLVVTNAFPARVIDSYVQSIDVQGDANNLRHLWLPFLQILVDFELFPLMNGAWLVNAIVDKLLLIIETQTERKVQLDAVRLLRRMFAAQVYNPRFQRSELQEQVALLYSPSFLRFTSLTRPGKLLALKSSHGNDGSPVQSSRELEKELLACVGHLVASISSLQLRSFLWREEGYSGFEFTETLTFYHHLIKKVKKTTTTIAFGRCEPLECNDLRGSSSSQTVRYDEAKVHATLTLIQRLVETFLVPETSLPPGEDHSFHLLTPDLRACESERGLSMLETRLAHRRSLHHGSVGGYGVETSSVLLASKAATSIETMLIHSRRNCAAIEDKKAGSTPSKGKNGQDYGPQIAALQQAVAWTALRVFQAAVDEYEAVIRLIEGARTPRLGNSSSRFHVINPRSQTRVSHDQALGFLGFLTELMFQLLTQASSISGLLEESKHVENAASCFVVTLFQYLQTFVARFSVALFATRVPGLPAFHDRNRIQLLLSLATMGNTLSKLVRQHAAALLRQLLVVCYQETGSFWLVKAPILQVLTAGFFPRFREKPVTETSPLAWRELLDDMQTFTGASSSSDSRHFVELINDLTSKVHVYERWKRVFDEPEAAHDVEEIQEGIARVVDDLSPHLGLLEEKLMWWNGLLRLHVLRAQFAEAVCCKLAAIDCVERATFSADDDAYTERLEQWIVRELYVARQYAAQAEWIDKELSISERLLVYLKQQRRFKEYQAMLCQIATIVDRLVEKQNGNHDGSATSLASSFYRVQYTGGCVPIGSANDEFIYKRSPFTSLGEFISELKTMLRLKYRQCERVDVMSAAPKALESTTGRDDPLNVICLRVTTVEQVNRQEMSRLQALDPFNKWHVAFRYAVPFTLGSSSYGKTSDQLKRITFLMVNDRFPCRLTRQRVEKRLDQVRCPIENSMDDIQKRCALLRAEVEKEKAGKSEWKTLTLVLKGSVDTHVHGGIPEVLDAFFVDEIIGSDGQNLKSYERVTKQHELANLVVEFVQLCWQCLGISRKAFCRLHQPVSPSLPLPFSSSSSSSSTDTTPSDEYLPPQPSTTTSSSPLEPSVAFESDWNVSLVAVSPLQIEFERSFAALVDQIKRQIPFHYANESKLTQLHLVTASLRSSCTGIGATSSSALPRDSDQ